MPSDSSTILKKGNTNSEIIQRAPPDSTSADELRNKIWQGESVEDWDSVLKTNVTSVYFSTLAFLPYVYSRLIAYFGSHLES